MPENDQDLGTLVGLYSMAPDPGDPKQIRNSAFQAQGNWRIVPVETMMLEPNVSSFKIVSQTVCNEKKGFVYLANKRSNEESK